MVPVSKRAVTPRPRLPPLCRLHPLHQAFILQSLSHLVKLSISPVPLSLFAPEFMLPLLLFGLRLLALEFDWAARLYVRVEKLARRILGFLKMLFKSKLGIVLIVVAVVIGVAGAVWRLVL